MERAVGSLVAMLSAELLTCLVGSCFGITQSVLTGAGGDRVVGGGAALRKRGREHVEGTSARDLSGPRARRELRL